MAILLRFGMNLSKSDQIEYGGNSNYVRLYARRETTVLNDSSVPEIRRVLCISYLHANHCDDRGFPDAVFQGAHPIVQDLEGLGPVGVECDKSQTYPTHVYNQAMY